MMDTLLSIDWKKIFLGEESWSFLPEAALRTLFMFSIILLSLRLLGKRGVGQLSVFELGVIIGLGSAAGDPMFYKDVGLLVSLIVFTIVMSLYKLVTYGINKSERVEQFIEGNPSYVIREGRLLHEAFDREDIATDELLMELRLLHVSHLGQIRLGILEPNGEVSLYYYSDEEVRPGLPILPHLYDCKQKHLERDGSYACCHCGYTQDFKAPAQPSCPECKKEIWVKAIDWKRLT